VTDTVAASGRVHHVGAAGNGTLAKLLVNLLWFGQAVLVGETLLLAQAAGLDSARLAELLPATPAASDFVRDHLPALLAGDYLASFGLDRVVEELDGLQRLAHTRDSPFAVGAAVSRVHREALERYGARDGELLAVAHLEAVAGRSLSGREQAAVARGTGE
jgi:3-hydroxyisobutyrate dehydrogenase-like beta-hydroxyacid dehydrogenase